jgi:predicted metal-binding membrane protein
MNTADREASVGNAIALFSVAALAWGWLLADGGVGMAHMDMGGGEVMRPAWTAGYAADCLAMWVVMMVAMMLPSATPAVLGAASPYAFAAGYLAVWTGFSFFATFTQFELDRSGLLSEMMSLRGEALAALVILAVGVYQFTPMKHACLERCARPRRSEEGAVRSLMDGLRYGADCFGCCWALMALIFVAGLMNFAWVAAIALWLTAEKLLPWGGYIAPVGGAGLIAWGGTLLALTAA